MMHRQTILVAGATGSIGGSAAAELARRGARVMLLGRNTPRLSSRADSIRDALADAGDGLRYPGAYDNLLILSGFIFNGLIVWPHDKARSLPRKVSHSSAAATIFPTYPSRSRSWPGRSFLGNETPTAARQIR